MNEQALYIFFSISIVIGIVLIIYSYTDSCRKERRVLFTFLGCLIIVTTVFITLLATGNISLPSLLKVIPIKEIAQLIGVQE